MLLSRDNLLFICCLALLGGLRLTSTTTTTTFVAAMSLGTPDLDRYFRSSNSTPTRQQILTATTFEERIGLDYFSYAFLNYSYYDEHNNLKVEQFNEEKARFGEGRVFSVTGKLVHITDAQDMLDDTACSPNIMGTKGEATPEYGHWIALVRRGRCTFEEKVRNVYAKRATGVIVYNDRPVMTLEKMQIKGQDRDITAVITFQEIGVEMARIVDKGFNVTAHIIKGRDGVRPINSLNRTSVLFVSISFIVLMVISLVWLVFYYIQRFRYLQTKDQQSRHLCSVTKKAITKIPTKTCKSSDKPNGSDGDSENDCCPICIEAYKPHDCVRILPCKHEFHKNCIDPWLIEHRTCPMCKLDVLKFYGYVVGDQIHSTPTSQRLATPPPAQQEQQQQHQLQEQPQLQQEPTTVVIADHDTIPVIVVAVTNSSSSSSSLPSTAALMGASNSRSHSDPSPSSLHCQVQLARQPRHCVDCAVNDGAAGSGRAMNSDNSDNRSLSSANCPQCCCKCVPNNDGPASSRGSGQLPTEPQCLVAPTASRQVTDV